MLSKELRSKIQQIQIYTSRMVNASFAGQYESVFKGRGMEFDEVREYMPGDDVRSIDWNVTARTGRPHIKRYKEERELTVMFMVDLSASGDFGSRGRFKNEVAAEFCAVLAFAAIRNNDKVGLIIFTDQIELFIAPKKGSSHVLRLIRELLHFEMPKRKTNIGLAMDYIARVIRKKATVFLVSDFIGVDAANMKKTLSLVNKRHDVIAVPVSDPAEKEMPPAGIVELFDAESGERVVVDTSSKAFRKSYRENTFKHESRLKEIFRSTGIDSIAVTTDKPYINDLVKFFHMRHRRF